MHFQAFASAQPTSRILLPETYKGRISKMWEGRDTSYDSSDTFHEALAMQLVRRSKICPGSRVLDLATGTGMVAIPAAQIVGKTGKVVGVDLSASMLAEAEKKAKALELENCTFIQADAETWERQDGEFNTIFCSSGMLYLQDIALAIRRFHSWLKPKGQLCFNTPKEPCVPATLVFYDLLRETFGIKLADAAAPLANTDLVKKTCLDCEFTSVAVEESAEVIVYQNCSPEEYAQKIWKSLASNAIMTPLDGMISLDKLEKHMKELYMQRAVELAQPWKNGSSIENPYTMLWVVAEK